MMRNHLNFLGKEILAGQSCDTMIRSDQRGKRWFTRLAESNYEYASANGVQAVFGFPNRNSFPGFMKYLGWYKLFGLGHYYYRLGAKKLVGNTFNNFLQFCIKGRWQLSYQIGIRKRIRNYKVYVSCNLPYDLDAMLREINTHEVLSVWKDTDYLKWRYEKHPHHEYVFYLLTVNKINEMLVVIKKNEEKIQICELLSKTKNVLHALFLIHRIVIDSIRRDAQYIEFHGYDDGFLIVYLEMPDLKATYHRLSLAEGSLRATS